MIFKPTSRFGLKNNINEIERRLNSRCASTMHVLQIRCGSQVYNLVIPKYLMPGLGNKGMGTFVEERRATAHDYMQAQMRCKQLSTSHITEQRNKLYEVITTPNRVINYPVLMIDNY